MALDYSKLSDEELKAIAEEDYSKLSESTLQALSKEPVPKAEPKQATTTAADYAELAGLGAAEAAGAYGAYKYYQNYSPISKTLEVARNVLNRVTAPPANAPIDLRTQMGGTPAPATPPAANAPVRTIPINPQTSPILGPNGMPITQAPATAPVAPQTIPQAPAAPQAAQPGIIDRTTQMLRQLAASKAMQGATRMAGTAAAALTPGNIGQNYPFPTSGPMRGSEMNPATGRPWTPEELAAYRAQYGQ